MKTRLTELFIIFPAGVHNMPAGPKIVLVPRYLFLYYTSNKKVLENEKSMDEKVIKQDRISTIIVNYSDKIIRK